MHNLHSPYSILLCVENKSVPFFFFYYISEIFIHIHRTVEAGRRVRFRDGVRDRDMRLDSNLGPFEPYLSGVLI